MPSPISKAIERVTWKRILYHPLTWLAVGLHVALLVIPFDPTPPAAVEREEERESEEAIPVDLLNLSEIATSTPPPKTPSPPAEPQPAPPPLTAPSQVAAAPPDIPVEQAPIELSPVEQAPTEQAPTEQTPTEQTPVPFNPGPQQGIFIQGLGDLGVTDNSSLGMPLQSSFRRPENYSNFVAGPDQAAPGARGAKWLDDERSDLLPLIQNTYAAQNLTLEDAGEYGGEALYELKSADGQSVMFVSIVELEGSSLLVLWNANPLAE